jgi:large subunit ribosomal protein L15
MKLHTLKPAEGSTHARRRIGRGPGSGLGGTSTRGHKGAKARSGYKKKVGFEGGQMPLQRRLPKRGFKNYLFKMTYEVVNLDRLLKAFPADQKEITLEDIYRSGLVKGKGLLKVLGTGDVDRAVAVEAFCFSKAAKDKILAAGGEVRELLAEEEETEASEE